MDNIFLSAKEKRILSKIKSHKKMRYTDEMSKLYEYGLIEPVSSEEYGPLGQIVPSDYYQLSDKYFRYIIFLKSFYFRIALTSAITGAISGIATSLLTLLLSGIL